MAGLSSLALARVRLLTFGGWCEPAKSIRHQHTNSLCVCVNPDHKTLLDDSFSLQGAMAATYSALKNSQPTPELKPIESSFLAQRRVKKLPSTSL